MVVLDQLVAAESGREYLTTGANIVVAACCLDHPQTGPVGAGYQLVAYLYETQRMKACENAPSLPMVGKMRPVWFAAADFLLVNGSEHAAAGCPEHAVVGTWEAERSRFLIPSGE